jgi:hypothetical protein
MGLDINGRIILKRFLKKWDKTRVDWIDLAQDRDQWWAVVNIS